MKTLFLNLGDLSTNLLPSFYFSTLNILYVTFQLTANVIVPGTGSLDDALCLSNVKLRDPETHSADITIDDDEDLSEPETNEWDDAEPDNVKRKTASKNATDLEVNETMHTQSGYVCSRV